MSENPEGTLSVDEAALKMSQGTREGTPDEEDAQQDETEATAEEAETEEAEAEAEAEEEGDTEDEAEAEAEEGNDDDDLYEVEGVEFTLSQLKEWQEGGLRTADYTKKTMAVAEERKALAAERAQFDQQRQAELQALQAEKTQLQEALATFAIDGEQEPDWPKLAQQLDPREYNARRASWDLRQSQKQEAARQYQALQQQTHAETLQREQQALLRAIPEWQDAAKASEDAQEIAKLGTSYGLSPEELSGINDHRYLRILNDLKNANALLAQAKGQSDAATKRVVKAAKKLPAGSKPSKNQATSKARQKQRDQLRKSGSLSDAVALMGQL